MPALDLKDLPLETSADGELLSGKFCPHCGRVNTDENTTCDYCGKLLDIGNEIAQDSPIWSNVDQEIREKLSQVFAVSVPQNLYFVYAYPTTTDLAKQIKFVPTPYRIWLLRVVAVMLIVLLLIVMVTGVVRNVPFIEIVILWLALSCLSYLNRSAWRRNRLFFGKVVSVRHVHGLDGHASKSALRIDYECVAGTDTWIKTVRVPIRPELFDELPPAGTPVAVLRLADGTYRIL